MIYESQINRFKESFLLAAARGGRIDEVASLIELGADVDCITEDRSTSPLSEAIVNNNVEVASLLLANGADPKHSIGENGNNALHLAAVGGNEEICALLLTLDESEALHCPNNLGLTPFDISVEEGYLSLAETLHNFKNMANNAGERSTSLDDSSTELSIIEDEDDSNIRDRFLSNATVSSNFPGQSSHLGEDDSSNSLGLLDEDENKVLYQTLHNDAARESEAIQTQLDYMRRIQDENTALREEERAAKSALSNAENAVSILEGKCKRLQIERDEAKREIDELCNGDLASKSLEDLDSMEKKIRLTLDRISERKEKLALERLSEEEEKRFCVVCQSEPKTVLLMPCRHLCVCESCSKREQLDRCPLCRQFISQKINVYS